MGKKSTPEAPEPIDMQEMLKYNTDLNRFDSFNPFGSQTWTEDEEGRWAMHQKPNEELLGMLGDQYDFVNRGPEYFPTAGGLESGYSALSDRMAAKHEGQMDYTQGVPSSVPSDPSTYATERPPEAAPQEQGPTNAQRAGQHLLQGSGQGALAEAMLARYGGKG